MAKVLLVNDKGVRYWTDLLRQAVLKLGGTLTLLDQQDVKDKAWGGFDLIILDASMVDDLTLTIQAIRSSDRLARIEHLFLLMNNTPESRMAAKELAVRLGYKARILNLPNHLKRGEQLAHIAVDQKIDTKKSVLQMVQQSKAFSPFNP